MRWIIDLRARRDEDRMGIDALDIIVRVERAFGVRPGLRLYTGAGQLRGRIRGPITVGEALQYPPEEIKPEHRLKEDLRADFG